MPISLLNKRKAQLKMGENIAILLVFFILFGIGFIFYYQFFKQDVSKVARENFDTRAVEISQKIFFLPELQCTMDNVPIEGCVDRLKAQSLGEYIQDNPRAKAFYYNIFGFSSVNLYVLDSSASVMHSILVYNNSLNDTAQKKVSYTSVTLIPVLVYEPLRDQRQFGVLNITIYRQ